MALEILVADIGGTHARFALARHEDGRVRLSHIESFRCAQFTSVHAAVSRYLEQVSCRPRLAAIAVAGPVRNGVARLTNLGWEISAEGLRTNGGLEQATIINDFAALGLAAAHLHGDDLVRIGTDVPADPRGSIAVVGPGTGFGVTALIRDERGQAVVSSEGGHVSFCPQDDIEVEIWRRLQRQFGRVSIERILCGAGLVNLHRALREIEGGGEALENDDPAGIAKRADAGDALCIRTLERFGMILGSVAGDFALCYGATGGVVIAGGIAPQLRGWIERGPFRLRFDDKGRLSDMVKRIPTSILLHSHAALVGAAWSVQGSLR